MSKGGKYIKCIIFSSVEKLEEEINKLMEDERWDLITIDSQTTNHLGIQQMLYKAWLQHDA